MGRTKKHFREGLAKQSLGNFSRGPASGQQMAPDRDPPMIWEVELGWNERAAGDTQARWRRIPCQVSVNTKDGEQELEPDSWPQKLRTCFLSAEAFKAFEEVHSKYVTFHEVRLNPIPGQDLERLTTIISTGFVGCVFFKSSPSQAGCDTIMIFFYNAEERAYNGFIVNDHIAFVNYTLKAFQEDTEATMKEEQIGMPFTKAPSATGGSRRSQTLDSETVQKMVEHLIRERPVVSVPSTSKQADRPKPGIKEVVVLDPSSNYTLRLPPETSVIKIPVAVSTADNSPTCPTESQDDGTRAEKKSSDDIIAVNVTEKRNSSEISQPCQPRGETNRTEINSSEGTDNAENEPNEQNSVANTTTITSAQPGKRSKISESWDEKRLEVAGDPTAGIHSKRERAHLKRALLDADQDVIDRNFPRKPVSGQQMASERDQCLIWQGNLEWEERLSSRRERWRGMTCQVLGNHKDGKPEINADYWPQKLKTYFSSEESFAAIGKVYLKLDSKCTTVYKVRLDPIACKALKDLTKFMSTGFVGCAFVKSPPSPAACDSTVIIFFYNAEEEAFNGFTVNGQAAVVEFFQRVYHERTPMVLRGGEIDMFTDLPSATGDIRRFNIWDSEIIRKCFEHIANRERLAVTLPSTSKQADRPKPGIKEVVVLDPSSNYTLRLPPETSVIEIPVADSTADNSPIRPTESQDAGTRAEKKSSDDIIAVNVTEERNSSEITQSCQPCDKTHCTGINSSEGTDNAENEPNERNSLANTTTITPAQPGQRSQTSESSDEERLEVAGDSSAGTHVESAQKLFLLQKEKALDKDMEAAKNEVAHLKQALILKAEQEVIFRGEIRAKLQKAIEMQDECQGKELDVKDIEQSSHPHVEPPSGVAGGISAGIHSEVADNYFLVLMEESVKNMEAAKNEVAHLKQALLVAEQAVIDIGRKHAEVRKLIEMQDERQGKKSDVNDIKQSSKPQVQTLPGVAGCSSAGTNLESSAKKIDQPQAVELNTDKDALKEGEERVDHPIWQGSLEWVEERETSTDTSESTKHIPCQVSAYSGDGEPTPKVDWPKKLIMQLRPNEMLGIMARAYLKISTFDKFLFHLTACEARERLTQCMRTGFSGWVEFTPVPSPAACETKVLIIGYSAELGGAYLGHIPRDQGAFADCYRKYIQQHKTTEPVIGQEQVLPVEGRSNNHMSSRQSVPSVSDLIKQQQRFSQSIVAPLMGMKKTRRGICEKLKMKTPSISNCEERLEKLNLDWERYRDNHYFIECNATEIEKLHKYFEEDLYEDVEIKFQASRKHLEDLLGKLKADAGMQEWQEVRKNGFNVAWDGFLEWSPPMDEKDSQAQEPLRVHCQISVNVIDGKLEMNTDAWDRTLKVKFLSKLEIRNVRGSSTSVIVDRGPHEDRKEWASLQSAAARGMMPFTTVESPTGDTKTLVFEYLELIQKFVGHVYNGQYSSQQCPPGTAAGSLTQAGTPEKSTAEDGGPGTPAKDSPTCSKVQTPKSLDQGTRVEKRPSDEIDPMKVPNKRMNSDIIPAGKLTKTTVKGADARQPSMQQILKSVKKDEKFPKIAETSPREDNERQVRGLRRELRIEMAEGAREDATVQQLKQMRAQKIAVLQGRYDIACELKKNYEGTKKRRRVNKLAVKSDRGFKCRPRKTWY